MSFYNLSHLAKQNKVKNKRNRIKPQQEQTNKQKKYNLIFLPSLGTKIICDGSLVLKCFIDSFITEQINVLTADFMSDFRSFVLRMAYVGNVLDITFHIMLLSYVREGGGGGGGGLLRTTLAAYAVCNETAFSMWL